MTATGPLGRAWPITQLFKVRLHSRLVILPTIFAVRFVCRPTRQLTFAHLLGGAQSRSKSSVWKPKKRKKPLTRKGMTIGAGNRVDGASLGLEKGQDPNSTYRKRATSKSARALRLEATEKRLAAMVGDAGLNINCYP